jgi:hypothetical protein
MKNCLNCNKEIKKVLKFCNKSCAASFNNRLRIRSDESKNKVSISMQNFNKLLDPEKKNIRIQKYKETRRRLNPPKYCITCNKEISRKNKYSYCKEHWIISKEFELVLGHNRDYKKGYVYNKWTKDYVYLLSSLEYIYYNYLEKNNIQWKKPKPLVYNINGKDHLYFCDFYLCKEKLYVEIKGYYWEGDIKKLEAVKEQNTDIKLIILNKEYLDKINKDE